jgi:hypothetical protein
MGGVEEEEPLARIGNSNCGSDHAFLSVACSENGEVIWRSCGVFQEFRKYGNLNESALRNFDTWFLHQVLFNGDVMRFVVVLIACA